MLLEIINTFEEKNPNRYNMVLDAIRNAYWPKDRIVSNKTKFKTELSKIRPPSLKTSAEEKRLYKQIRRILTSDPDDASDTDLETNLDREPKIFYSHFCINDTKNVKSFLLPFSGRYFDYFSQRQYPIPYPDPENQFENITRLEPVETDSGDRQVFDDENRLPLNYSKNYGDYNHFLNVVLATARLINFFSEINNFSFVFDDFSEDTDLDVSILKSSLCFHIRSEVREEEKREEKRIFLLMLAAYYHDLGKTVVYPRHAMEGSVLIANHTATPVKLLNDIAREHSLEFETEDLMYMSHLVYYHDQFGTLGTGEAGYFRLVDLLHRLKQYCYRRDSLTGRVHGESHKPEYTCIARAVFDLWLLNVADMMVSIGPDRKQKFRFQRELGRRDSAFKRIKKLLHGDGYDHELCGDEEMVVTRKRGQKHRKHDLVITMKLAKTACEHRHADDLTELEQRALAYARRHTVERVHRLMRSIFIDYKEVWDEELKNSETSLDSPVLAILNSVASLTDGDWHAVIARSISSVSDFNEFTHRLAWVGQLDYSFSFFRKLASRVLHYIENALRQEQEGNCIGSTDKARENWSLWLYYDKSREFDENYLNTVRARYLAENFSSILVQILHHLIFREKEFDRLINFEFRDAADRLTDEKIDRIIAIEGPYRAKRAVQLALEGIFFFK